MVISETHTDVEFMSLKTVLRIHDTRLRARSTVKTHAT